MGRVTGKERNVLLKILIIRHADPDYSIDSLTPKGWREAELLSRRLAAHEIRDFYCSPMGRARDTAKVTLEKLGRDCEVLPWLREFSGTVMSPFEERLRVPWNLMPQYWTKEPLYFDKDRWLEAPFMASGNVAEVYQQTADGIDEILSRYGYRRDGYLYRCEESNDCTIVLFCHFGVGLAILSHMLGFSLPLMWQSFFLPPSSVTILRTEERVRGEAVFRCVALGDISHLYAGDEPMSEAGLFPEIPL